MIHLKDIVSWQNGNNPWVLKNLLREVLFISPTMRTLDLLLKKCVRRGVKLLS